MTNLRAYTFQTARNEWVRWLDKKQRDLAPCQLEPWFQPTINEAPGSTLDAEAIQCALHRLKPAYREVVELKTYSQLTFEEIADVLRKPPGTVATWYRRALEQLRKHLEARRTDD